MSGAHSIDQVTAEQPAVAGAGFAPPVAEPGGAASPPPPPVGDGPDAGAGAGAAKGPFTLPTGGNEALERPEAQVGLAFAGGFVAALILKRLVG